MADHDEGIVELPQEAAAPAGAAEPASLPVAYAWADVIAIPSLVERLEALWGSEGKATLCWKFRSVLGDELTPLVDGSHSFQPEVEGEKISIDTAKQTFHNLKSLLLHIASGSPDPKTPTLAKAWLSGKGKHEFRYQEAYADVADNLGKEIVLVKAALKEKAAQKAQQPVAAPAPPQPKDVVFVVASASVSAQPPVEKRKRAPNPLMLMAGELEGEPVGQKQRSKVARGSIIDLADEDINNEAEATRPGAAEGDDDDDDDEDHKPAVPTGYSFSLHGPVKTYAFSRNAYTDDVFDELLLGGN